MKPNTMTMLDLSTGHLSLETREWLEQPGNAAAANVTLRENGYFVPAHHDGDSPDIFFQMAPMRAPAHHADDSPDLNIVPLDLLHCVRYAGANGASYVLFDSDADRQPGLPWYEDGNTPDLSGTGISENQILMSGDGPVFVNPNHVQGQDLKVERSWTETLEDGDYEAPDGAWIDTGEASVRIRTDEEGDLHLTVFGRGAEMDTPVAETSVRREDLEESVRAAADDVLEP